MVALGNLLVVFNKNMVAARLVTLFVFHLEISGKDDKDSHPLNKNSISVTLFVFHPEISGKDDKDSHWLNKDFILVTLFIFHLEISNKDDKDLHS